MFKTGFDKIAIDAETYVKALGKRVDNIKSLIPSKLNLTKKRYLKDALKKYESAKTKLKKITTTPDSSPALGKHVAYRFNRAKTIPFHKIKSHIEGKN